MRKRKTVLGLALVLTLLASCGNGPEEAHQQEAARPETAADAETVQIPDASGMVPPDGEPVIHSDRAAMLAAYTEVLNNFYFNHTDPSGQDMGSFEGIGEEWNQFAVFDVDLDGQDELLVSYTATIASAGMREYVFGYDGTGGNVREEFSEFPLAKYYDNGIIEAGWSHNQGRAGDALWPYTFWRYDPQSDTYQASEMADAWDKSLVEDGFPDSADKDGDGLVYYLIEYGNYVDYASDTPVDKSGYDKWRESFLGGANELAVPYVTLNEENIKNIR